MPNRRAKFLTVPHGLQYMSHHFQTEIAFRGIESSPAFIRVSEGKWLCRAVHP
jgi:hypothetical protein